MSIKIYTNFLLSLERYNLKINYLKDKMRHGMWVRILLKNLASSPLQQGYYFWHRRSKCFEKAVKFYSETFEFKVFMWSNKLGTEYLVQKYQVMKSSNVKLRKSLRKTNYTYQNENSLDSLASNLSLVFININNLCSFIFETMPQVSLLLVKVWVKDWLVIKWL